MAALACSALRLRYLLLPLLRRRCCQRRPRQCRSPRLIVRPLLRPSPQLHLLPPPPHLTATLSLSNSDKSAKQGRLHSVRWQMLLRLQRHTVTRSRPCSLSIPTAAVAVRRLLGTTRWHLHQHP